MLNFGNEFEAREGNNDASLGYSSVIERSRNEHALSSSLANALQPISGTRVARVDRSSRVVAKRSHESIEASIEALKPRSPITHRNA